MTSDPAIPASAGEGAGVQALLPMIFGSVQGQALRLAAELDLAERLAGGAMTLDELASATGAHPGALARVLRALVYMGVLGESDGRYECTALGALLRRDTPYSLHSYARMNNSEWLSRVVPHLGHSVHTGEQAFGIALGTDCYDYLQHHPDDAAVFNAALTELSRQDGLALRAVYDFTPWRGIVDVGAGEGEFLRELLDTHRGLEAVAFDLPAVIAGAAEPLRAHVEAGRCRLVAGDFREEVPAGGDLYVLKRIVSTCAQEDVRLMLANLRGAIPAHGRVLLADPDPETCYGALFDVLMLVTTGGSLRTESDMRALLAGAGFELLRTLDTPATLRVVEAAPA